MRDPRPTQRGGRRSAPWGACPSRKSRFSRTAPSSCTRASCPWTARATCRWTTCPRPCSARSGPTAPPGGELAAVVAGQRRVLVERTALNLRELLDANPGAAVTITETGGLKYQATIVGVPERSAEELEAIALSRPARIDREGHRDPAQNPGRRQGGGHRPHPGRDLRQRPPPALAGEEFRDLLTLKLDWAGRKPKEAAMGLVYLQRGLRWIPGYQVELDAAGGATVKLQATLVNDLVDLDDAEVNLVVGVPSFAFAETVDPIRSRRRRPALPTSAPVADQLGPFPTPS
ncbi:MAG: hypothetical protein MZV63_33580 [Marinilabiliales bacterium]|nr:hypothetical protein [Marinilabiliales bacterium]